MFPADDQVSSTADSGNVLVAILKLPATVACIKSSIAFTRRSSGILPMPLPISWIAEERSAALGSVMLGALTAPT